MAASSTAGASSSSSWLDTALADAGIGRALTVGTIAGESPTATLDRAQARAEELGLGSGFDAFRSALTWVGSIVVGAEILIGVGLLVFLVWLVRKGALEIFG